MNEINWIDLLVKLCLFLASSYLLFYRSWLKSIGKEIAKLSTRKQLTELEEQVKSDFNNQLELYKSNLSKELAERIEPIKSELARNNITHQIEYSYLHQQRAKVILELYHRLQELHSAMIIWTQTMHPVIENADKEDKERTDRINKSIVDFKNYYVPNKLFFSSKFCDFIDDLFKEYWDKGWEFGFSKEQVQSGRADGEYFKHYSEKLSRISNDIRENFPTKILELENKFRKMLKVEDED